MHQYLTHHAAVKILLHLAEGMRGRLTLARDDDADVSDSQSGVLLALRRPPVGDIDALWGITADVGRTARGCGLDEVAALLQSLLPLIQHTVGGGQQNTTSVCSYNWSMQFIISLDQ